MRRRAGWCRREPAAALLAALLAACACMTDGLLAQHHHVRRLLRESLGARSCGSGQAWNTDSGVCIGPCAQGQFIDAASAPGKPRCAACPAGSVSAPGATACSACPNGTVASPDGGKCVAPGSTCHDGVLSGTETDVDCGGQCSAKCDVMRRCRVGADCLTGSCDPQTRTCGCPPRVDGAAYVGISSDRTRCLTLDEMCSDGFLWAGVEADVDCGGPCPRKCAAGRKCKTGSDCRSGSCDSATNMCTCPAGLVRAADGGCSRAATEAAPAPAAPTGSKQKKRRAAQPAVAPAAVQPQAAGPQVPAQQPITQQDLPQRAAGATSDAAPQPGLSDGAAAGSNSQALCRNGVLDGSESDTDCGRACDRKCPLRKKCRSNGDCVVGSVCDYETKVCRCGRGFGGANCQVKLSTCDSANPCRQGQCVAVPGAAVDYKCACKPGWAGPLCERDCWADSLVPDPTDGLMCQACPANSRFIATRCVCEAGFEDVSGGSLVPQCKPCGEGKVSSTPGSKCETCPGWPAAERSAEATKPNADRTRCVTCTEETPNSLLFHGACGCADNYSIFRAPGSNDKLSCVACPAGCSSEDPMDYGCRDAQNRLCG